jgi:hypothetical protein
MKDQTNAYNSKERTRESYLMTKTTDELSVDPIWHKFVQECINENGYSWYYHARQQPFGRYIKMNYSKTRRTK